MPQALWRRQSSDYRAAVACWSARALHRRKSSLQQIYARAMGTRTVPSRCVKTYTFAESSWRRQCESTIAAGFCSTPRNCCKRFMPCRYFLLNLLFMKVLLQARALQQSAHKSYLVYESAFYNVCIRTLTSCQAQQTIHSAQGQAVELASCPERSLTWQLEGACVALDEGIAAIDTAPQSVLSMALDACPLASAQTSCVVATHTEASEMHAADLDIAHKSAMEALSSTLARSAHSMRARGNGDGACGRRPQSTTCRSSSVRPQSAQPAPLPKLPALANLAAADTPAFAPAKSTPALARLPSGLAAYMNQAAAREHQGSEQRVGRSVAAVSISEPAAAPEKRVMDQVDVLQSEAYSRRGSDAARQDTKRMNGLPSIKQRPASASAGRRSA